MNKIKNLQDQIKEYLRDTSEENKDKMMKLLIDVSQFIIGKLQELNVEELQIYTIVLNDILEAEKNNDRVLLQDALIYGMLPLLNDYIQIMS